FDPWPLVSNMAGIYLGMDETNAPRIARRELELDSATFVAGQNGVVSHLILNRQGNLMEAKKNAPFMTTLEILREYLGDYFNHDLNATYQIRSRDGALVAEHSRHSAIPLMPMERDKFSGGEWWFGEVAFRRD